MSPKMQYPRNRDPLNALLRQVEDRLGYHFHAPDLLLKALTHPSFAAEQEPPPPHNQRLEFLGDAVLQFLVSELLFEMFPERAEGELTRIRSALTKEETLVAVARGLELGAALRLGKGESRTGGRERPSNLGDAFEAVLAAVYVDGGIGTARELCRRLLEAFLDDPKTLLDTENPKGALQEAVLEQYRTTPVYELTDVSGPEHLPTFHVRVLVNGVIMAAATAGNRKAAESGAARKALDRIRNTPP